MRLDCFLRIFDNRPSVHIFCKILKDTRKKEKIARKLLRIVSPKILKGLTLSQWGGIDYAHSLCLTSENVMVTPLQLPITNTDTELT